jgi:hypothetical protein
MGGIQTQLAAAHTPFGHGHWTVTQFGQLASLVSVSTSINQTGTGSDFWNWNQNWVFNLIQLWQPNPNPLMELNFVFRELELEVAKEPPKTLIWTHVMHVLGLYQ